MSVTATTRRAYEVIHDDHSYTFLKPGSSEHHNRLIVVYENAYGNVVVWTHDRDDMCNYLTLKQVEEVFAFFDVSKA